MNDPTFQLNGHQEETAPAAPDEPVESSETSSVTDHDGQPILPLTDFFVEPPAEIGRIVTKYSSLNEGVEPKGTNARMLVATGLAAAGYGLGYALMKMIAGRDQFWNEAVPAGLAFLGLAIGWFATRFAHKCSYVGELGFAMFTCRRSRENIKVVQICQFADATDLRTSQTRHYHNGVYTGTNYSFKWSDETGRKKFELSGNYRSKEGTPKRGDDFYIAQSAEFAWSIYLLDRADAQLKRDGFISFKLGKKDAVRVGPAFLEIEKGGLVMRIDAAEFGQIAIQDGSFTVSHKDAKKGFLGIGKSGIYSFEYGKMANARLFLFALDRLMGVRF